MKRSAITSFGVFANLRMSDKKSKITKTRRRIEGKSKILKNIERIKKASIELKRKS
jgi:hypothetical protein